MKIKLFSALLIAFLLIPLLCSCFSADVDEPYRGNRDGIEYLYLEDRALLILSGEGTLYKENRICTISFFKKAEYLFVSSQITEIEDGIFSDGNLKAIYLAGSTLLDEELKPLSSQAGDLFEERTDLPFAPVGHCPSETKDNCMLCGTNCYYEYLDLSVRFCLKGTIVKNDSLITEGKTRTFDEDGILQSEGFDFLAGSVRYFRENRMITGSADIDEIRYTFSTEGALRSSRPLDSSVSPIHIIIIIAALPVGAAISYGVYLIYKKKNVE